MIQIRKYEAFTAHDDVKDRFVGEGFVIDQDRLLDVVHVERLAILGEIHFHITEFGHLACRRCFSVPVRASVGTVNSLSKPDDLHHLL